MDKQNYFSWLSSQTVSEWTNDSGILSQNRAAISKGAVGCTTNPPLSYEALVTDSQLYAEDLKNINKNLSEYEFGMEAMGLVAKKLSKEYLPMYKDNSGKFGRVSVQVCPDLCDNPEGTFNAAKTISGWGENIMVKIPVTQAGIWALEELAAIGVPTNPTVTTSISQIIAAAEAYERGAARAKAAGIVPARSCLAFVFGRIQDYLTILNTERSVGLAVSDLEWASVALLKRCLKIFKENNYSSILQPAAFRAALHVEQISGSPVCSTIHPKIQKMVEEADKEGKMRREILFEEPVDQAIIDRVSCAFPEFVSAYEPGAVSEKDFITFGPTVMTLDTFAQGWKKIISLKV